MSAEKKFDINDWGGYAKCYDALNSLRPYQKLLDTVISHLNLSPGQKILDAACGTGNLEWRVQKGGGLNGARIVGIDHAQEMLGRAKEKCEGMAVDFKECDLNHLLPFPDASFSQIVSVNTIYALAEPHKIMSEFQRLLEPGGKIILVNPKKGFENGLILKAHCKDTGPDKPWMNVHATEAREKELVFRAVRDHEVASRFLAIASFNRKIAANKYFHFLDAGALEKLIRDSGLCIIKTGKVYADQGILAIARK